MSTTIEQLELQNAESVCDVFERAAEANHASALRRGSMIELGDHGQLLISGDLHDHRVNMRKIVALAQLRKDADHHVLFQELVHSERLVNGMDLSYRSLAEVAHLQLKYPGQVHVLMGNHEIAQIYNERISKAGVSSVEAFDMGLEFVFSDDADTVRAAIITYVKSMALAVRCANGVMCCHSLPNQRFREKFDMSVIERETTDEDWKSPAGSAYLTVWGRGISQAWADELAAKWGAKVFVLGHQPAEMGYELAGDTMLIMASDHEHGAVVPVDLSRSYTRDDLVLEILPLAAMS